MQSPKRHSLDKRHNAFVQAIKEAYRCNGDTAAINLLLDFIQDEILETALARIDWVQQSPAIPAKPTQSKFTDREGDSSTKRLAALLPEEF